MHYSIFGVEVFESTNNTDALLVSYGGLRTLDLLEPLERHGKIPVSSLAPALRAGMRLLHRCLRRFVHVVHGAHPERHRRICSRVTHALHLRGELPSWR